MFCLHFIWQNMLTFYLACTAIPSSNLFGIHSDIFPGILSGKYSATLSGNLSSMHSDNLLMRSRENKHEVRQHRRKFMVPTSKYKPSGWCTPNDKPSCVFWVNASEHACSLLTAGSAKTTCSCILCEGPKCIKQKPQHISMQMDAATPGKCQWRSQQFVATYNLLYDLVTV